MSKIVNLRGTSGSGKSTLITNVMKLCSNVTPVILEGRKHPLGYTMATVTGRKLFIPGHYVTQCGGCDTISKHIPHLSVKADGTATICPLVGEGITLTAPEKPNSYDTIFGLVKAYSKLGYDVLFEGLLISGDLARTKALKADGFDVEVVAFGMPVEFCLEAVKARRLAKGNTEPLDEKNTRDKHKLLGNCLTKLSAAGLLVHVGSDREATLNCVKMILGL